MRAVLPVYQCELEAKTQWSTHTHTHPALLRCSCKSRPEKIIGQLAHTCEVKGSAASCAPTRSGPRALRHFRDMRQRTGCGKHATGDNQPGRYNRELSQCCRDLTTGQTSCLGLCGEMQGKLMSSARAWLLMEGGGASCRCHSLGPQEPERPDSRSIPGPTQRVEREASASRLLSWNLA